MKILFIPSAEIIPIDMQKKFGEIPSALVPLAETTILENILNKYNGLYDKAIIIVYKQKEELKRYIKNKGLTVEIIELDTILDLGNYCILTCAVLDLIEKHKNMLNEDNKSDYVITPLTAADSLTINTDTMDTYYDSLNRND